MGHRIIFATGNEGKMREIRLILADLGLPILSMKEAGAEPEIVENGATFGENAEIKARAVWNLTGAIVLADDSGLEVDCLDGAPGVYSARYAGEGGSEADCNRLLLLNMAGVPEERRTARYRAALVLALPDGRLFEADGACEGRIGFAERGEGGFGYDPLFILTESGYTMAEISPEEKNRISHRGIALRRLEPELRQLFNHITV